MATHNIQQSTVEENRQRCSAAAIKKKVELTRDEVMTASPNRRYSGHCKAAEVQGSPGTPGKVIWSKTCGQQEKDGGSSIKQSWMKSSGLWPLLHGEQQCVSQVMAHIVQQQLVLNSRPVPSI